MREVKKGFKKEELARCYYEKMLLFGAMEYYNLKETKAAGAFMEVIDKAVEALGDKRDAVGEITEELFKARQELEERVDVLTACVDRLEIYQYALNRVELRFAKKVEQPDEEVFIQKVMEYIFSSRDNMLINELIKEVISQLPVRMTKGKYFERIREGLSIYQDADKSSLDSMLYMLRTSSMLYHPKKEDVFYKEYTEAAQKVGSLDFAAITKEEHEWAEELLEKTGDNLMQEIDLCMLFAEAVNHMYALFLLKGMEAGKGWMKPEIERLFVASREGRFEEAQKELVALEGCQEKLLSEEGRLEHGLFEADPKEEGVRKLRMVQALGTDSLFMSLDFESQEAAVDSSLVRKEADKLIEELKELFSKNSMLINRAIMANTLSKLPVFFESSKEVMEYIQNSLEQCHDAAEKTMSMKLIYHIMEG